MYNVLLIGTEYDRCFQEGDRERIAGRAIRPRALLRSLSSPDSMRPRRRLQAADSSLLHLEVKQI